MPHPTFPPLNERDAEFCLNAATRTLERWAIAVSRGEKETLLSLYAEDAILVPTVANDVRDNRLARQAYFDDFLAKEALTCELGEFSRRVSRKLGTVVIGGHYTFGHLLNGEMITIPARFLFTFEEIVGEWKITGHHSSQLA
ncbi:nuclear transport factor 2 family protein [Halomonas sp. THAF12]|uniref:nuclear transport factor 2 family protein n=1 Tax=Halomonas sp. B23F22_10 TaxID=3459515 RepID=UPI00373EAE21